MSILSGLLLQPRAAIVTPPQVATVPVPVAPTPNPAPTAPVNAYNPLANGEIALGVDYAHRSAGNTRFDGHDGPGLDLSVLWPRFRVTNNVYASTGLYLRREHVETTIPAEFGPDTTSYANFTSAGIQAYIGWNPSRWFETGAALRVGFVNASSEGTADGLRGLRYSNLVFPSGVDATTFDATLALRAGAPRIIDSAAFGIGLFFNASVGIPGTNTFNLLPGYDTTTTHDSAIGVPTSPWTLGASVVVRFGRAANPRAVTPAPIATVATTPNNAVVPTATPVSTTVVAPVAATPVASTTTRTHINPIVFTSTSNRAANERALKTALQTLCNAIHLGDGLNTAPSLSGVSLTLTFDRNNRGQIRVNHVAMADGVNYSQRGTNEFPASIPEGLLQRIEALIHEMVTHTPNGIPTYTGSHRRPIHVTISRNTNGSVAVN